MVTVRTHEFQASVFQACRSRKDKWSNAVSGRIAFVNDLPAADAVYHQQCSVNFKTGKNIPNKLSTDTADTTKRFKRGIPETKRAAAFLEVAQFLEDNNE